MLLRRIELHSFRQFVEAEVEFADGITVIQGDNGSGKTSILESVKYALYGECRGKKETLPNIYHGGKMSVTVDFDLGDERYRCTRNKDTAELWRLGESDERIAFTLSNVTAAITKLLGLTDEQFCSSYFTEQKEIEFLKFAKARQQEQIAQMLGIELIADAAKVAKETAKRHFDTISALQSVLESKERLQQELKEKEAAVAKCVEESESLSEQIQSTAKTLEDKKPQYICSEEAIAIYTRIEHRRDHGKQLDAAVKEAEADLKNAATGLARRKELDKDAKQYIELAAKKDEQTKLLGQFGDREKLTFAISEKQREKEECEEKVDTSATAKLAEAEKQLALATKQFEEARADCAKARSDWLEQQHLARASLTAANGEKARLESELRHAEEAISKGICPTCGQQLKDGKSPKIAELKDAIAIAEQKIVLQSKLASQLESPPKGVIDFDKCEKEAEAKLNETRSALNSASVLAHQQQELALRVATIANEITEIETKIAASPSTFDRAAYDLLCEQVDALSKAHAEWQALSHVERAEEEARKRHAQRIKDFEEERAKQNADKARLNEIGLSQEQADNTIKEYTSLRTALPMLEKQFEAAQSAISIAKKSVTECNDRIAKWEKSAAKVAHHQHEHALYKEVTDAMNELRTKLNSEIRPTLAALAGETLAQITNHRYGRVEIDESFKASIYDENKTKPVISGGEEDVLALALRVALSRYILDKSGMPASMLVMDEVFGSLDADRRANVMEMFDGLSEIFPQIILISHVELPNQGNRVLQVEYDTNAKQSSVSEFTSQMVSL